jgi:uncharacterized protein
MQVPHFVALVCSGALALLLFVLGALVSGLRAKYWQVIGVPSHPDHSLTRAIRSHGNTAEYVPTLCVLFLLVGSLAPTTTNLWLIVAATIGRFALAIGLFSAKTLSRPSVLRGIGAFVTYSAGTWLAVVLILVAMHSDA